MFIYAANWKMKMSFNEAVAFCKDNYKGFLELSELKDKNIVIFPEFTQIKTIKDIFDKNNIFIGAQDCSVNDPGAFTGQVSVSSLKDLGCSYCIIEHSEMREYRQDSPEETAVKILRLDQENIIPVLCVGEYLQDFLSKKYRDAIKDQINRVFELISGYINGNLYVAYEPVFAIGTGNVPEIAHIEEVFDYIIEESKKFKLDGKIKLMYGGSVNEKNAKNLKNIRNLNGFLLGGVSLDFKNFKKIVEL